MSLRHLPALLTHPWYDPQTSSCSTPASPLSPGTSCHSLHSSHHKKTVHPLSPHILPQSLHHQAICCSTTPRTPLSSAPELQLTAKNAFTHHCVTSISARSLCNFQIKLLCLLSYNTAAARLSCQVGWKPLLQRDLHVGGDMMLAQKSGFNLIFVELVREEVPSGLILV